MNKTYCWLDNKVLEYRDITNLLIENRIKPICGDRGIALSINLEIDLKVSSIIWEYSFFNSATCYLDEPLSMNKKNWGIKELDIYGESSTEDIAELVKRGAKQITFTAYGQHLFRFRGINFRMPFTNQAKTWEYLERKYSDKFNHCWIHISQVKDFKELINWCKTHNKIIMICGDYPKLSIEQHYNNLIKFIEALND